MMDDFARQLNLPPHTVPKRHTQRCLLAAVCLTRPPDGRPTNRSSLARAPQSHRWLGSGSRMAANREEVAHNSGVAARSIPQASKAWRHASLLHSDQTEPLMLRHAQWTWPIYGRAGRPWTTKIRTESGRNRSHAELPLLAGAGECHQFRRLVERIKRGYIIYSFRFLDKLTVHI